MYRFLLKPRWVLSHIFVLACVVAFVSLGLWQLRRLDERKALNAQVEAAEAMAPVPVGELVADGPAADGAAVDAVEYRPVTVTGTYRTDQQVLVANRSNGGAPGYWVLTPVEQSDGTAVVVNRGWVPNSYDEAGPWTDFDPPSGPVTVAGMVRAPQVRASGGLVTGPKDPESGVLRVLARVDVARLAQQVPEPVLPLYVMLTAQQPVQGGSLPAPVPAPTLDEGPHLNYAGQWFIFTLLTLVVYPLLLRRVARRRLQGDPDDELDPVAVDTDGRADDEHAVAAPPSA